MKLKKTRNPMNFFKENFNESGEQPNAVNQRKFTMRWKSYEMHIYTVKRISVRVWVWNDIAHAIENAHMENCDIFQRITAVICWWSVCTFHNIPLRLNSFRFYPCPCVCMCNVHVHLCESMLYILQMMLVLFVIWNERSFSFGFASYFIGHKSSRRQRDPKRYACERVKSRISEALRIPILISIFWGLSPVE